MNTSPKTEKERTNLWGWLFEYRMLNLRIDRSPGYARRLTRLFTLHQWKGANEIAIKPKLWAREHVQGWSERNRETERRWMGMGFGDQAGSKYRRTTFIFSALIIHLAPELVRLFLPRSQIKARAEMDAPRRNRDPTPASWNVQDQPWLLAGFGPPENRRRPRILFSLNYPYFPRFYLLGNVARKDFSWVISSLREVCLSCRRNALTGRTLFRYVQDY